MSTLGSVILKGVYSAIPTAGIAGRLYFATDTGITWYDNGSSWVNVTIGATPGTNGYVLTSTGATTAPTWQPSAAGGSGVNPFGVQFTPPPPVSTLTWINQGGATAADQNFGIFMKAPPNSGDSLRCLVKSAYPSTPYTFTVAACFDLAQANFAIGGICLTDGTKFVTFSYGWASGITNAVFHWSNATTNSAAAYGPTTALQNQLIWLRLTDDGTNFVFSTSVNGVDFTTQVLLTESRTAYMSGGPTKVGIFLDPNNASHGMSGQFLSWTGI
jgi:hypothetical protein